MDIPLLSLIRTHTAERSRTKKDILPKWVRTLATPDPDDPDSFVCPQCFMTASADSTLINGPRPKLSYYKLDPNDTLANNLRGTHFVEFPTIEIWEEGLFNGTIVDAKGVITWYAEEERKPKRRKLNPKAAKKTIHGLLGDYGSDEDEEKAETENVLSMLQGYAESDDEGSLTNVPINAEDGIDSNEEGDGDFDSAAAAALIELLQTQPLPWANSIDVEDMVDWGDSDEDEPLL